MERKEGTLARVKGELIKTGVTGRNGTSYSKEAVADLVAQMRERAADGTLFVKSEFGGGLSTVQGVVRAVHLDQLFNPSVEVDILDTEEGRKVAEFLDDQKQMIEEGLRPKEYSLAWSVNVDDSDKHVSGDETVVHKAEIDELTFTDDHSFDVDPVTKLK